MAIVRSHPRIRQLEPASLVPDLRDDHPARRSEHNGGLADRCMRCRVGHGLLNDPVEGQDGHRIQFVGHPLEPEAGVDRDAVHLSNVAKKAGKRGNKPLLFELRGPQPPNHPLYPPDRVENLIGDHRPRAFSRLSVRLVCQELPPDLERHEELEELVVQLAGKVPSLVLGRRHPDSGQPLHPLPRRDVADRADHVFRPRRELAGAQADLHGEGCAILAQGLQLESLPHRTRTRRLGVLMTVPLVPGAAGFRNQHFHARAFHLLAAPSEHRQRLRVQILDQAAGVHDQHRVRRCLEHGPVVPVAEQRRLHSIMPRPVLF